MSDKIYTIDEIKAIAVPIAKRYGISALYLFGSYARGEATSSSDLDFRIKKGNQRSAYALASLYGELEDSFDKELDVLTTPMLSERFLRRIRPEEVLIYAQQ